MESRLELDLAGAPSAARIVAAAELAACAEAEKRGLARGLREGEARALAAAVRRLDETVAELLRAREETDRAVAEDSAKLALMIAREIVRTEVDAGRYDIERIVREALQVSGAGRAECVVHLHADDLERLAGVAFRSATRLEADPEVTRGDVHVSTPRGVVVRDLDAALAAVLERLKEDRE
jgi:flagellar biosynthesis/type III secretory pathway protein FliH